MGKTIDGNTCVKKKFSLNKEKFSIKSLGGAITQFPL